MNRGEDMRRIVSRFLLYGTTFFLINSISEESFNFSVFEKMFGVTDTSEHDNCISYLFLCSKFYIHSCQFQESDLSFVAFMNLVKTKRNIEYKIAVSKGKLRKNFKKWTLILMPFEWSLLISFCIFLNFCLFFIWHN